MAVKYRLIERKNLGNDKTETPKKQYAQVVYGDLVEFETFLEEVADGSGVGSAQVKAVLDRINIVLKRNLSQGRRVNVGELGNFRFGVGSTGAATTEEFSNNLIYVHVLPRSHRYFRISAGVTAAPKQPTAVVDLPAKMFPSRTQRSRGSSVSRP